MEKWFNPETVNEAKAIYLNYTTTGINPFQLRGSIIRLEKMRLLGYDALVKRKTKEDIENIKKTSSILYELRFISLALCPYESNLSSLVLCVLDDRFKKKFTQPESVEYYVLTKLLPQYMQLNKVKDCSHMSFTAPRYGSKTFPYDSLWYDPKIVQDAMDLGLLPSKCTVKDNFVTLMPRYLVEHNPFYIPICSASIVENIVDDQSKYIMLTETNSFMFHTLIQGHTNIPHENVMEGIYHMEDIITSSLSRRVSSLDYNVKKSRGISDYTERVNNYKLKGSVRPSPSMDLIDAITIIYGLTIRSDTYIEVENNEKQAHVAYLKTMSEIESYRYYKDSVLTEALPMFYSTT